MKKLFEKIAEDTVGSVPKRESVQVFTEQIFQWMFADFPRTALQVETGFEELQKQFSALLCGCIEETEVERLGLLFYEKLPNIYEKLIEDREFFFQNDPAAEDLTEVALAYPGFFAISIYRLAHELFLLGIPYLPRMMSEYAHSKTGIDIHPAAQIGRRFFIDHGTGVVIGATTQIGTQVSVYQGVTLGALQVEKSMAHSKRHPTLEDGVTVYANATILGGSTVVGRNTIIGGNTWLTTSAPAGSMVIHAAKPIFRTKQDLQVLDFVI